MQTPRRSSRKTRGIPPPRFGRDSWLIRAGQNPYLCMSMEGDSSTTPSGSEEDSSHNNTIVDIQQPPPDGTFSGHADGQESSSGHSSRSSSISCNREQHIQNLIDLNSRVIHLHSELDARMRERNELEESRRQAEEAFAAYRRRHETPMQDAVVTDSLIQPSTATSTQMSLITFATTPVSPVVLTSTPMSQAPAVPLPPTTIHLALPLTVNAPRIETFGGRPLDRHSSECVGQLLNCSSNATTSKEKVNAPPPMYTHHTAQVHHPPTHVYHNAQVHHPPEIRPTNPSQSVYANSLTCAPITAQPKQSAMHIACQDPASSTAYMPNMYGHALPIAGQAKSGPAVLPSAHSSHTHQIVSSVSYAHTRPHSVSFATQPSSTQFQFAPPHVPQPFDVYARQPPAAQPFSSSSAYAMPRPGLFAPPLTATDTVPSYGMYGPPPIGAFGGAAYGGGMLYQPRYEQRRLHDLPAFSGRPEEWPMFFSAYSHTTAAYGYSQLENQTRLQKSLCGEAKKSVECLLIHPQHVDTAMARLGALYGRPEQLVRSQIKRARELPAITEERIVELISFATTLQNLALFLDTPTTQYHLADPTLLEELVRKLPMGRRIDWAAEAARMGYHPSVMDFARWVTGVADLIAHVSFESDRAHSAYSRTGSQPSKPTQKPPPKRHVLLNVEKEAAIEPIKCTICSGRHEISQCAEFEKLSVQERWQEVAKTTICYGCLDAGHILPGCDHKRQCGVDGCDRWHHKKLHVKKEEVKASPSAEEPPTRQAPANKPRQSRGGLKRRGHRKTAPADVQKGTKSKIIETEVVPTINHCDEVQRKSTLLFRIIPVTLHGPSGDVSTFALLDEGSSITLVDADLADDLGLQGPSSNLSVHWFSSNSSVQESRRVSVDITGQQAGCARYKLSNVRTIENLSLPAQTIDSVALSERCPHLRSVPLVEYVDAKPKVLIGLDHHHLGMPSEIRADADQRGIVAAKTPLGWVIYGSDGPAPLPRTEILHIHDEEDDRYEELNRLVRSHFSTEAFGCKVSEAISESDETKRAREILQKTTRRIADDRFEVGLLWRTSDTRLPPSSEMALRRLRSVEARMRRDPAFGDLYNAQIQAYVEKGYARRLSYEEARTANKRSWFLPHFAVFNANKPGKFRLVFDAAATVGSVSLNSALLSGPDVNTALVRLLMQFRTGEVGIVGDIKEMFHQVRVREADQVAQKFLWRFGDSTVEPGVYVMRVMTFGATCSPASAQHIKNVNASEFASEYPAAAAAIHTRHYVDDYVASYSTAEEAAAVTPDVIKVHRRGGFELRGFTSNSRTTLQILGADMGSGATDPVCLQLESSETEKVLGMCWNTEEDVFQFRTKFVRVQPDVINGLRTPTKREILSVSMSLFDPYGLLAEFMLESKLILQDLWRIGLDWDTPVPDRFAKRWEQWRQEVEQTKQLKVPRCYSRFILTSDDVQLHIYADASEAAFSAVAYWRVKRPDGIDVSFVLARTRCAPLQILSIPRLELQAAVLATRLLREIRDSHPDIKVKKVVLWSDSVTVLSWLLSDQRKYKPFVQFRVAEILETTPASFWRWVPTSMNVADDATRVKRPVTFRPDSRWTRGPAWLRLNEEEWPVRSSGEPDDQEDPEVRRNFVGTTCESRAIFDYARFGSLRRLCRTTALMLRYINNLRCPQSRRATGPLDANDIESAMLLQCRMVQRETYSKEMAAMKREDPIERKSDLYPLKAYLANDDLVRMYGRTDSAEEQHLSYDSRSPILLPRHHRFTWLLVQEQHERNAHQLTNATIAAIRRRFWVPQVRMLLRSVQAQCVVCKRRSAQPVPPVQGQLPIDRLTPYVRPFTSTGLDFFGPVYVTVGRRREKRWVAVFTCLAVRAIHLEIAADLTTDSCLVCIRNLCHVRGTPSRIRCDNGTNFVGARNTLAKEEGFLDAAVMQRELCSAGIQWVLNCPGNPEAGGIWERMVQSVKRILAVTLKDEAPRVETLRAHLLEAANMLNSRPLTHVSVSPDDDEALTPNHFLIGGPNSTTMTSPTEAEPAWTRKQWRISRELSRRFWVQWVEQYLPELTRRTKDYPERKQFAVDDVVIVCDASQPRGRWPIGRIVSVVTGKDGRVRTAEVKTKDGVHRRPVARLAVLDVLPDSN